MSHKYTIADYRNNFGIVSGSDLNAIYVGAGNNPYAYMERQPARGGEAGIPYFVEFRFPTGGTLAKDAKLVVEGAPDTAVTDGSKEVWEPVSPPASEDWKEICSMPIASGTALDEQVYRLAVSENPYKWLRARYVKGSGETAAVAANAVLYRA
jgi:hypothetical protein